MEVKSSFLPLAAAGLKVSTTRARAATIGPVRSARTTTATRAASTSVRAIGIGATATATTVTLYEPFARSSEYCASLEQKYK